MVRCRIIETENQKKGEGKCYPYRFIRCHELIFSYFSIYLNNTPTYH